MYDIIGDIHGYSRTLEALLRKLGYLKNDGIYSHPYRKAIFVGDYIDRGPSVRESLIIIKSMTDKGSAFALMGNHEYNAICYHTPSQKQGEWLRERTSKNVKQHSATLSAFLDYPDEWKDYLNWFLQLPVFLDLGDIRIIHAFWDNQIIENLRNRLGGNLLNREFIRQSAKKGSKEYEWIENILKGCELSLPDNTKYTDKDGFERSEIRVKWWKQMKQETFRSITVKGDSTIPETLVSPELIKQIPVYPNSSPPVFVGHYWNVGKPELLAHNVCCVDYSVARGEKLVAYQWNGENLLDNTHFVYQDNMDLT